MIELREMLKIADVHANRIMMALNALDSLFPLDAKKIESLSQENLLMTDLLVHRFGKLQDLLGSKIINEFLVCIDEYESNLSMLDKVHKLERLEIIEDSELWKEMRKVRNHVTHEYPNHPEFTAADLNKMIELAPKLIKILENIQNRVTFL